MKILITGAQGQLGSSLATTLTPLGTLFAFGRAELDLANMPSALRTLERIQPDLIINAAAYTAVDRAEVETELAYQVNAEAPRLLAQYCSHHACALIHYSTDYVFNGQKESAYTEEDEPDPINVYGRTKRQGEVGILESGCPAFIFRTSWVYSLTGRNFLTTMQQLGATRDELRIVNDQWGSPTWTYSLARATFAIIDSLAQQPSLLKAIDQHRGIYHMSNQQLTTWYDFARAIFALAPTTARVTGIPSSQYPTPAQRPAMSGLNNQKLKDHFDISLANWHDALQECLQNT
ncbi:MAG: dTDP-4-dehydrorhamnose reductase [Ferrovum sp. 37-45-19]|nr:MAG: dTDP-4-dehydrorhamnose reductase [Ferrovum sp. 21-44-67]OYV93630.1 MAG: dTDP-4-dehydrorhamnose reductase [Ferrovum sp. 37-45-19]OZB33475.1 MAG: dTDP-4-dehydrorhamnose reductase [Ferrovum sp. 34-44-207]HQT81926.1 dTDP-4-dehydrorhamnose reductase [Ferrovaceae bacterium]HQU07071.1 dTDP-4-dehydrorhamnose reductase [Ferrovaceae bacterium]